MRKIKYGMGADMIYRVFSIKKAGFDVEAQHVFDDLKRHAEIETLTQVRILNRYDVSDVSRDTMDAAIRTVFSEPQCDDVYEEDMPDFGAKFILPVESLPGQFDQRSDSCAQCIQVISGGARPIVRAAKVFLLSGDLTQEECLRVKSHLINPVDSREAALAKPETLAEQFQIPQTVSVLSGFCGLKEDGLSSFLSEHRLAMDLNDLIFMQEYFKNTQHRDPTITEDRKSVV